jgi:hypothetical protein
MLLPLGTGDRHIDPDQGKFQQAWNLLANVLRRPEEYRSLAHRSFGWASQAGLAILMTGLALGRGFIVPLLPPRLGGNHTECLVLVNPSERSRTGHGPPMCRPLWPQGDLLDSRSP